MAIGGFHHRNKLLILKHAQEFQNISINFISSTHTFLLMGWPRKKDAKTLYCLFFEGMEGTGILAPFYSHKPHRGFAWAQ